MELSLEERKKLLSLLEQSAIPTYSHGKQGDKQIYDGRCARTAWVVRGDFGRKLWVRCRENSPSHGHEEVLVRTLYNYKAQKDRETI